MGNTAKTAISLENYLGKLQGDGCFVIPDYQRGYIWGQYNKNFGGDNKHDSVTYLIQSLLNVFENDPGKDVFLQGITVHSNQDSHDITIVDGQQRTTFFFLLLKYLGFSGHFPIKYTIRKESNSFLATVDIDNCLVDEKEPFQDIYFFKKTICTFQSKLRSVNKPAFLSFVLAHVKFLYIIIPENKARVIFSMMNGNKAIMRQEELIKAELLRCSSVNTELILDAENNAIRNRFAREWDKWLYWWNTPEVKEFYHTDYQLGWLLPLIENKEDISFDRFKAICLKNGDVKEAKGVFRRMRLLQKSIEDAYNDPISYNLIGTVLCLRGKKEQFQFLKWYFAIVGTEDHRVVSKELQRYFDWSILGATHQEIIDNNIDQYANRRKDFLHQLVSNDLYRSAYNTGAVWLLRCNVMQDCALNEGKGRKFSFDIWKNRSLEHIYPKSKVKHFQNGITLDWNDNPIDSSKLSDYKLDREDICLEIPSPVDNEEPTLYRASEHSIGNLVLLYKRNNSSFNARDFEEKKQIFFTIQDDEGFQSRHLIHTVSVFAHSKWEGKDIAKQKKTEIEHFESEYKEDYYE